LFTIDGDIQKSKNSKETYSMCLFGANGFSCLPIYVSLHVLLSNFPCHMHYPHKYVYAGSFYRICHSVNDKKVLANACKGSERRGEESSEMRLRSGVEKSRVVTGTLARELSAREPPRTDDLFPPSSLCLRMRVTWVW